VLVLTLLAVLILWPMLLLAVLLFTERLEHGLGPVAPPKLTP
jgi:hypothetical protein